MRRLVLGSVLMEVVGDGTSVSIVARSWRDRGRDTSQGRAAMKDPTLQADVGVESVSGDRAPQARSTPSTARPEDLPSSSVRSSRLSSFPAADRGSG